MRLGLHIASGGNLMTTPERARAMGADVIQIFAGNPRGWRPTQYTPQQGEQFRAAVKAAGIQDAFIHEVYLVSYGTPDEEQRQKSIATLSHTLQVADLLGVKAVVTHMGSHKGEGLQQALDRMRDSLTKALKGSENSWLALENSAGAGGNIGNSIDELAQIFAVMENHPRLKVCIDTAHAFTSGYDIRSADGVAKFLDEFDQKLGLDRLACMHLNDSKADLGSHIDRHENIGDGFIGLEGFRALVNEPRLANVAGLMEVPGLDNNGPDAANLQRLRDLIKG